MRNPALHDERAVSKQVEIAVELQHLHRVRAWCHVPAQRQDVAENVIGAGPGLRPEKVLNLALLHDEGRLRELGDVAAVVEVEVAHNDVGDIVGCEIDFLELCIDRDIWRIDRLQRGERGTPVARVGDNLVVVTCVEENIPFRMFDHVKTDRNLDRRLHGRAVHQISFAERQRAGTERVELEVLRHKCRTRQQAREKGNRGRQTFAMHFCLPGSVSLVTSCSLLFKAAEPPAA